MKKSYGLFFVTKLIYIFMLYENKMDIFAVFSENKKESFSLIQ